MDIGGAALAAVGQEQMDDGLAQQLMSAINQLLGLNRSQMATMAGMQEEMESYDGM